MKISRENFKNITAELSRKKILVIGDVMLDTYIDGEVERISPEAPVPVVLEKGRTYFLGGAGNVAKNVATLGGQVYLSGIIGSDQEGKIVRNLITKSKIHPLLVVDRARPTTTKTRVTTLRHQLLRIDQESTLPISKNLERHLTKSLKKIPNPDVVVISDYLKGCLTADLVKTIKKIFNQSQIVVDLKPSHKHFYRGVFAITPNLKEAHELTGFPINDDTSASRGARLISQKLSTSVVLTRGEKGITVFDKKTDKITHIPSKKLPVFDVTGAGDTVIAAISLFLATGVDLVQASKIANLAAGRVVGSSGTTTVTLKDLENLLNL